MALESRITYKVLPKTSFENKYCENILNTIPSMASYVDKNLNYQYANAAFEQFFNRKKETLIGENVADILGEETFKLIKKDISKVLKGKTIHFEREMCFHGRNYFMDVTFIPDINENDEVQGYTVFASDITDKKGIEKRLEQKNNELQDYFENAAVALHWVNENGIIIWANKAEMKLLGYTDEEYIGHHITEFHADKNAINDILCRLSQNEELHRYEAILKCKDGSLKNVIISSNVLWQNGKFIHTRCFTLDITEQKRLFKKLSESEHRYRELIEKLPVAIYTCDAEGRIDMYNSAAVDLWGREPEIGKDMWCGSWRIYQLNGESLSLDSCPMAIALKEGAPVYGEEIVVERPDGKRLNVLPHPLPILSISGEVIGAVNMLLDITERKKSEEINARLAAIVQSSDDAIVSKTLNGIVTSWNDAAEKMFGYTAEEMIGSPITKIIPPDRLHEEDDILARLRRGEKIDHFETIRITKNKLELNISVTISPVKDKNGNIIGASKIARDITQQKKLFNALQESEERFRIVADSAPVMIWMTGADNRYNFFNKVWLEFSGATLKEELNKRWVSRVHPDDVENCLRIFYSSFHHHEEFETEYRFRRYDGEYRWVSNHGMPRYASDGTFLGYTGICIDIHEKKAAHEELEKLVIKRTADLQEANIQLQKSNEELERFAYVASHDLQEPLRKIQAFGGLLAERNKNELTPDAKNYLDRMINSSKRMQALIEALLEFSRAVVPDNKFELTDLNELIHELEREMQEIIEEKNAVIHVDELPKLKVIPFRFKQMVSNILSNALKYTMGRTPVINIFSSTVEGKDINAKIANPEKKYCKLTIEDNGIGFEKEHSEKIFELFQRLHSRHEFKGSGIGLSICKKIAENHGGFITAEGEPRNGASFHIFIPFEH